MKNPKKRVDKMFFKHFEKIEGAFEHIAQEYQTKDIPLVTIDKILAQAKLSGDTPYIHGVNALLNYLYSYCITKAAGTRFVDIEDIKAGIKTIKENYEKGANG